MSKLYESLYRAKCEKSDKWLFGSLIIAKSGYFIFDQTKERPTWPACKPVKQFTVCRWLTTDMNGKKVFEQDIVSTVYGIGKVISYMDGTFVRIGDKFYRYQIFNTILLGNIFDNSDLINEKK